MFIFFKDSTQKLGTTAWIAVEVAFLSFSRVAFNLIMIEILAIRFVCVDCLEMEVGG